jgi:hypothetical protein
MLYCIGAGITIRKKVCIFSTDTTFSPAIFNLQLVESTDTEPMDMEGWLY